MSFLSEGWELNLGSQDHPGWKRPQEISCCHMSLKASLLPVDRSVPLLFAGLLLKSWWSPWPPAQLTSVYLEWEILHMKELHVTYIKHKTFKCAQRGLCRASKPLIYHTESGGAEVVLLRWFLHLLTAISMLKLTQASNLFMSARLDLCTLSLQRECAARTRERN